MIRRCSLSTVAIALLVTFAGCAHITFESKEMWDQPFYVRWFSKSDGIHYYRPKPYLLLTENVTEKSDASKVNTTTKTCVVDIKYLPDYSKEYVMIPHYWLGSVALKPTLTDGWNLTNFDSTVDTKIPDLINSLAGLAKTSASIAGAPVGGGRPALNALHPGLYPIVASDASDTKDLYVDTSNALFSSTGEVCTTLVAPPPSGKPPTPNSTPTP
jgi:hypothetical protein